nr:PD-(D/E)XK nuclease family protein [Candidatus Woesebacteria bacterium]
LLEKAIKIKEELPHYWFNEAEGFILCGKIDWLTYKEETDSVHILDFKTGKREEDDDSLQLPIYHLLVKNTQNREVTGASYWYLQKSDVPLEKPLPETTRAADEIMSIARRMKLARQLAHFTCQSGNSEGCRHCAPLEAIKNGKGKKVGQSKMRQDIYIL